jgi:AcrR family transcriptional regulator
MKTPKSRGAYRSPLRAAQAVATRERILDALADVLERGQDPTYAAVAAAAGVQERTVYRYFPTRAELHRDFWRRVHEQRIGAVPDATDLRTLQELVAETFAGFTAHAALVRAMLHSAAGRDMRLAANDERRRRFERVAALELPLRGRAERRRAAAAAQVLCSAMAWEYLQDYWQMSPGEATATVQQALAALFDGLRARRPPAAQKAKAPRPARARRVAP